MRIPLPSVLWRGAILALLLLNLIPVVANSPIVKAEPVTAERTADDRPSPIAVHVDIPTLPAIDETVDVTIEITSSQPVPSARVQIVVSDGMRIDGEHEFIVDVPVGERRQITTRVTPLTSSNHSVAANVTYDLGGGNVWGDTDAVYFFSDDGSASSSFTYRGDPMSGAASPGPGNTMRLASEAFADGSTEALPHDAQTPIPVATGEPGASAASSAPSPETNLAGTITIRGNTGMFARNGYWRSQMVLIELISQSGGTIGYTYSDSKGDFSFTVNNPGQFRLRVWANYRHESMQVGAIRVVGKGFKTPNTFSVGGWHYNIPTMGPFADGEVNIGTWGPAYDWEGRRAWWIYQDLLDGFVFPWFKTLPGTPPGTQLPDGVTVEWEPGSIDGAYYHTTERRIHLSDIDANSRHTVLHEYGHAIMQNVYGGFFPANDCPSPHNVESVSGPTCAWTEGWATFYALTVSGDPVYQWGCALPCTPFSVNFETTRVGSDLSWQDGDLVEGNVAAALWDLTDPWIDGLDKTNSLISPFSHIWTVVYTFDHTSFSQFWAAWVNVFFFNNTNTQATLFHNTIDYGWPVCPDAATEPDDNHLTVYEPIDIAGGPVQRAHCTDGDVDSIRFNVKAGGTYTIETMNLGETPDGTLANTAMTLYSMNQFGGLTELAFDDNSGTENLASKIVHTATTDGVWFAKVVSTHERGHFAFTYDVDVTESLSNVAPTVSDVGQKFVAGRMLSGSPSTGYSIPVTASWTASDPDDGIATQTLEQDTGGAGFTPIVPSLDPGASSHNVPMKIGTSNHLRISATDESGATSGYGFSDLVQVQGTQESAFTYSGTWTSVSSTALWGGSMRRANGGAGVKAIYTFTGRNAAIVGAQRPDGGRAQVYVDGVLKRTIDFYSPTAKNRKVLFAVNGLTNSSHTIELRWITGHNPASTGTRLYLDGGVALRGTISLTQQAVGRS
jgi:hypothetical protein